MQKHEFLPRAHPAEYGNWDISNWKDLKKARNLKFIDPAIRDLVWTLNQRGFTTSSSCSGGHKRNLNYPNADHERGYLMFTPATGLAFKLYFSLREKYRDLFLFDVLASTTMKKGSQWIEATELDWRMKRSRTSNKASYERLFEDMIGIASRYRPNSVGVRFSNLSGLFDSR